MFLRQTLTDIISEGIFILVVTVVVCIFNFVAMPDIAGMPLRWLCGVTKNMIVDTCVQNNYTSVIEFISDLTTLRNITPS